MKQLFKALFATALITSALISSVAHAQQKIGVINREAIIQQMPQAIASQQALQIEFKDETARLEGLGQQLNADIEKLRKDATTMSEAQIKAEQERIQAASVQFDGLRGPFQEKLKQRRQEENVKVVTLLNQAIQAIIDEEGLDLVLDRQAVVFSAPQYDISEKVLKKVSQM